MTSIESIYKELYTCITAFKKNPTESTLLEKKLAALKRVLNTLEGTEPAPTLLKIERLLTKIDTHQRQTLEDSVHACQTTVTTIKHRIERILIQQQNSDPTLLDNLRKWGKRTFFSNASYLTSISTQEHEKIQHTITLLEEKLSQRKNTLSFSKKLASFLVEYLKNHEKSVQETSLGIFLLHLHENQKDVLEDMLYANILNLTAHFYENLETIQAEQPFIVFELLQKGLETFNEQVREKGWATKDNHFPNLLKISTEKNVYEASTQILIPLFMPHGVEDFIMPNLEPQAINLLFKPFMQLSYRRSLENKLPIFIRKAVHTPDLKTKILIKIYTKILSALSQDHRFKRKEKKKSLLPEPLKGLCTRSLSTTLLRIFSGNNKTSRFVRTFSTPISKRCLRVIEHIFSDASLVETIDNFLPFVEQKLPSLLHKKHQPLNKNFEAHLASVQKELHEKLQHLPALVRRKIRPSSIDTNKIKKAMTYILTAFFYHISQLIFFITGIQKTINKKIVKTERVVETIDAHFIINRCSEFFIENISFTPKL